MCVRAQTATTATKAPKKAQNNPTPHLGLRQVPGRRALHRRRRLPRARGGALRLLRAPPRRVARRPGHLELLLQRGAVLVLLGRLLAQRALRVLALARGGGQPGAVCVLW